MAEPLQRTLGVTPTVTSVGNPPAGDNTTADLIQGVTSIATTFLTDKTKTELGENLEGLGEEVFAARNNQIVGETTKRFERLQKAQEQGVLDKTRVSIETEKILKESISSFPVAAAELRQEAVRILGFDPTGSQVRALFASTDARPKTELDKMRDVANAIAATTSVPVDSVLGLLGKARLAKVQSGLAADSLALGSITRSQFLNTKSQEIESLVFDSMNTIIAEIKSGGIVSPEAFSAEIGRKKVALWNDFRRSINQSGLFPSSSELKKDKDFLDSQWGDTDSMLEDGSLFNLLQKKATSVANIAKIEGVKLLPHLAVMNSVAGAPLVESYLNALTRVTSEKQLKLLSRVDPALGIAIGTAADATNNVTAAMQNLLGIQTTGGVPVIPQVEEVVAGDLIQHEVDVPARERVLDTLSARGKTFKHLSLYASKQARALATQREVEYVKARWSSEFSPLLGRLSNEVAKGWTLEVVGGVVKVVEGRRPKGGTLGRFEIPSMIPPSSLQDDLTRLNSFNQLLSSGWAKDIGEEETNFLERSVNAIGIAADSGKADSKASKDLQSMIEEFQREPTEENLERIRAIAPELVTESERRSAAGIKSRGN